MNEIVRRHFLDPFNMGTAENPTHTATVKSDVCSDIVVMTAAVSDDGRITDIKTKVYGCGYCIAGASFLNSLALGRSIGEVLALEESEYSDALGDLQEKQKKCFQLGLKAFHVINEHINEQRKK